MSFFFIGDTSHDGTNKNTYCSKVVYTSWYNAGENLDAGTFAGNLVSPDDIFDSTIDRYFTIKISFFGWSKTWIWKTYESTAKLLAIKER